MKIKSMNIISQTYETPIGVFDKVQLEEERSLRLVLTGRCNMACEFCVYKIRDFYSPEIHSPEFIEMRLTKELSDTLEKMKNIHHFSIVHFTGGEPMLSKDIGRIAKMAKNLGLDTSICTNLINIKKLLVLLNQNLIDELTFSYFSLDDKGGRGLLPRHIGPNVERIRTIQRNIELIRSEFPKLKVKTNICINENTDLNDLSKFIEWCWERNIIPRAQRDRLSNRITGSTQKTIALLKMLKMKPVSVAIRVPGAIEICKLKNNDEKELIVKIFNQNFRLKTVCKNCIKKESCTKSLSNIRLYNTKSGPKLCLCTSAKEKYANQNIGDFIGSAASKEISNYKKDKMLYFNTFCDKPNHQ